MNLFNYKPKGKVLKERKTQTGTSDLKRDKSRKALPSGKRISRTGKIYYEARRNRSDLHGSNL